MSAESEGPLESQSPTPKTRETHCLPQAPPSAHTWAADRLSGDRWTALSARPQDADPTQAGRPDRWHRGPPTPAAILGRWGQGIYRLCWRDSGKRRLGASDPFRLLVDGDRVFVSPLNGAAVPVSAEPAAPTARPAPKAAARPEHPIAEALRSAGLPVPPDIAEAISQDPRRGYPAPCLDPLTLFREILMSALPFTQAQAEHARAYSVAMIQGERERTEMLLGMMKQHYEGRDAQRQQIAVEIREAAATTSTSPELEQLRASLGEIAERLDSRDEESDLADKVLGALEGDGENDKIAKLERLLSLPAVQGLGEGLGALAKQLGPALMAKAGLPAGSDDGNVGE